MEAPLWFVFGLFVYFRQASLSLHRSNIERFPFEIIDYYQRNKLPIPDALVKSLRDEKGYLSNDPPNEGLASKAGLKCSNKNATLNRNEVIEIINTLEQYSIFFNLGEGGEGNQFTIEEKNVIRLLLTNCSELLEKKLPLELVEKGKHVKHINHSEYLELLNFQELVCAKWPFVDRQ